MRDAGYAGQLRCASVLYGAVCSNKGAGSSHDRKSWIRARPTMAMAMATVPLDVQVGTYLGNAREHGTMSFHFLI
jgi:hypothetical protein